MARSDWRKYYFLTFSDGSCGVYVFRSRAKIGDIVRTCKRSQIRPNVVGILHIKGKTPAAQQAIYARVVDKKGRA